MPNVPIVQSKPTLRPASSQGLSTNINIPKLAEFDVPSASTAANALRNFGNNIQENVSHVALAYQQREDRIKLQEMQNGLDAFENESMQDLYNRKGKNAIGAPQEFSKRFDEYVKRQSESLDGFQREKFNLLAASRKNTFQEKVYSHTNHEFDNYEKQVMDSGVNGSISRAIMYRNDDKTVDDSINNAKAAYLNFADSTGMPETAKKDKLSEIESKVHLGILKSFADDNPGKARDYFNRYSDRFFGEDSLEAEKVMTPVDRKYKATLIARDIVKGGTKLKTQDDIINFVMNDLEGGSKIVSDGGGVSKYGINSKANPELDVAGLDAAKAANVYKSKYWNAINADNLPPAMQIVAFDAAVNQGVGNAKKWLDESNGDPSKYLELRKAEYMRLAKENPAKYGQYLDGWLNRLTNVSNQVASSQSVSPPNLSEMLNKITTSTDDPYVAEEATRMVKETYELTQKQQKYVRDQANDEAWKYIAEGHQVPPSVEAAMAPEEVMKMRDYQQKKQADPEVYQKVKGMILTGQDVDLKDYRWQLGEKFDDLVDLQLSPEKRSNSRSINDIMKNSYVKLIKKSKPENNKDFEKIDLFERRVHQEIDALQKKTGKPASSDDVVKITDRMLMRVDNADGDTKELYKLKPDINKDDRSYNVLGMPDDKSWILQDGTTINHQELQDKIIKYLEDSGRPLNEDNFKDVYKFLEDKGIFKDSEGSNFKLNIAFPLG